jgi:hypothetical protein
MATREESIQRFNLNDERIITVILRKTIAPEDPYINLARAKALSVRADEAYDAVSISRPVKDHLIKTNIAI